HLIELLIQLRRKRIAAVRLASSDQHAPGKERDAWKAALSQRLLREFDRVGVTPLQLTHFRQGRGQTRRRQWRPSFCRLRECVLENLRRIRQPPLVERQISSALHGEIPADR